MSRHNVDASPANLSWGSRIPFELVVLGLLFWLPIETWVLKFAPFGSWLLLLPDGICLLSGIALLTVLWRRDRWSGIRRVFEWPTVAGVVLVVLGLTSAVVNHSQSIEVAYWFRVYVRFVPLAMIAATSPWSSKIKSRLPFVVAIALAFQLEVALFQQLWGMRAAYTFWPGSFQLGSLATAANTLISVQGQLVAGTLGHYNTLGWYIVIAGSILVGFLMAAPASLNRWVRYFIVAELVVAAPMLLLTGSRQAFFSAVVLGVFFTGYLLQRHLASIADPIVRRRRLLLAGGLVLILVLALGVAVSTVPALKTRASRYTAILGQDYWRVAADNRLYAIAVVAPKVLKASPMLGLGPGSFGRGETPASGEVPVAVERLSLDHHHYQFVSDVGWVSMLSIVGLGGVVVLALLTVALALGLRRNWDRPEAVAPIAAAIAIMVFGSLGTAPLTLKPTASLFWVLAGLYCVPSLGLVAGFTPYAKWLAGFATEPYADSLAGVTIAERNAVRETRWRRITVGAIIFVSAALRFFDLGRLGLCFDELFSVLTTSQGALYAIARTATDTNPPLYYVLQSLVTPVLGRSEWALRALPALAGVAATGVIYLAGKKMFGLRTGLWAAAIFAVSPLAVRYAQEARMYSLLMLLSALVILALAVLAKRPTATLAVLLGVAIAGTAYTHVYGYLAAPSVLIAVLLVPGMRRRLLRLMPITYGTTTLLFLPWVFVIPAQVRFVRSMSNTGEWWLDSTRPTSIVRTLLDTYQQLAPASLTIIGVVFIALLAAGIWSGRDALRARASGSGDPADEGARESDFVWSLVVMTFVPVIVGVVVSKYSVGIHNLRNTLVVLPAAYLLAVRGGVWSRRRGELVLLVVLLAALAGLPGYYRQSFEKGAWRAATAYVLASDEPGTSILTDGVMAAININTYADLLGKPGAVTVTAVNRGTSADSSMVVQLPTPTSLDYYLASHSKVIALSALPDNPLFARLASDHAWRQTYKSLQPDTNITSWVRVSTDSTGPAAAMLIADSIPRTLPNAELSTEPGEDPKRIVSYHQGVDSGQRSIPKAVSDPSILVARQPNGSSFVTMGIGGEIVAGFPGGFLDGNGVDIVISELSWYGTEVPTRAKALVYASDDGVTWKLLGKAENVPGSKSPDTTTGFDLARSGLTRARYVKVVDVTRAPDQFQTGFDLASVRVLHPAR